MASRSSASPRRRPAAVHRIEIAVRPGEMDPAGHEAALALAGVGLPDVTDVRVLRSWFLQGAHEASTLERAARGVLANPVLDVFAVDAPLEVPAPDEARRVEVTIARRPGVTQPEAESARVALHAVGVEVSDVHASRTFVVTTSASEAQVVAAARRALGNDVIEDVVAGRPDSHTFPTPQRAPVRRRTIKLRTADDAALETLSTDMGLSLSLQEMQTIQAHFRTLRREPTDVELETLAQTWSEHCKHKTLAGPVRMRDGEGERVYRNLLKETIFDATRRLDKAWCWSVFKDNAGVIEFDGDLGACMKVETHNHPSAIEPYCGAGTGIGGVIRDILGTGLGARPVANTDVFCFGDPRTPDDDVPRGCLHPARLLKGVVAGVRDYGNRMGIPTVNGAICFDPDYVGNPVVYAGCVGLLPKAYVEKAARPGDAIVAFGGRTGRDGIHGATFSSVELTSESETVSSGAVQIGDPITEKKVLDVLLQGRDAGWFTAVTDCGAGGFSSAVGEMGEATGAEVDLAAAPLKYPGLLPYEIWISEAQERMVAAVPPKHVEAFLALCASEDVEAVVLGHFRDDRRLVVKHGATVLADLEMEFLHDGLPRPERAASYVPPALREPRRRPKKRYDKDVLDLLGMPQIGSKEWVVRQYDHEVQAGAVVRAFTGPHHGPADAAVIAPVLGSRKGLVLANGINPAYGRLDPYQMALLAVDEALRNAVAVGADPKRIAVLDNFTWGRCSRPETLGALVRAAEGCRDAAMLYRTPFISGKDSLNNEFRTDDGRLIVVPPTLLVSAIGVIGDVRRTTTSDLKRAGDVLLLVGATHDELGGSHWYRLRDELGQNVPIVRPGAPRTLATVARLIRQGYVRAAHDLAEGGLAVAAAEMVLASDFGATIDLAKVPGPAQDDDVRLFSESATRFLLEVSPAHASEALAALKRAGVAAARVGKVTKAPSLVMTGREGDGGTTTRIELDAEKLRRAWREALPTDDAKQTSGRSARRGGKR